MRDEAGQRRGTGGTFMFGSEVLDTGIGMRRKRQFAHKQNVDRMRGGGGGGGGSCRAKAK
jgi:hypothetical protein